MMDWMLYTLAILVIVFGIYFIIGGWDLAVHRSNATGMVLGGIVSVIGLGIIVSAFAFLNMFAESVLCR